MQSKYILLTLMSFTTLQSCDSWLYDITKSFEENCTEPYKGPELSFVTQRPDRSKWISFLGHKISRPLGVAACAVMTSKGIELASKLGFDVLTYKTIRSKFHKSYDAPNLCFVDYPEQISINDIGKKFYVVEDQKKALSNSIGNACPDLEWVRQDIAKARACLCEGQVLMVSVFGDGNTLDQIAQDFAVTARLAYESGAHVIELNLSCPNINQHFFYKDGKYVAQILQKVRQTLPHIPVIVKVGLFESTSQMREIFTIAATSGAQGVCGINSIPVQVCTKNGQPFFGDKRRVNGLSGSPIRSLAQQFVKDARACIAEGKLNLVLLAAGGAMETAHFKEFLNLGATVALCATGFMLNPYIAQNYCQD